MKKGLLILLAAMMALLCVTSYAEEQAKVDIGTISINGAFTLKCGIPDGYEVTPISATPDQVIASITSQDETKPAMVLSVAFDETYADVDRMNDLDQEALALLEKTFTDMDPTVEISYGDTGLGTRLMIAKQTDGEQDYIDFLSVYKGYFVEFVMIAPLASEDKNLSDEQLQLCIDFLTDLDFVPAHLPVVTSAADLAGKTVLANLPADAQDSTKIQAELRQPIVLDPAAVAGLQEGGTLSIGEENIDIETIEKDENDGTITVNGDILLSEREDGFHVSQYENEFTEVVATLTLDVPDSLVFLDSTDPMQDEPARHTAAEFMEMLTSGQFPDFASHNVNITFGDDGSLVKVERFYTPWQ